MEDCLRSSFPGASKVVATERVPLSSFHHLLESVQVKVSHGSGKVRNVRLFVRVYRGNISWSDLSSTNLVSREWHAWDLAQRMGLPLPTTLWTGWSGQNAVAVQLHLAGERLRHARGNSAVEHFAQLLAKIHSYRPDSKDQEQLVDARTGVLLSRLYDWASEAGDGYALGVVEELQRCFADIDQQPAVLLHGDCHLNNVISCGRRVTGIVDWEDCSYGDSRLDIALAHQHMQQVQTSGGWRRYIRFARKKTAFLKAYMAASGNRELGSLERWHDLIDARSLVVGSWLTQRAKSGLSHPPTTLRGWETMAKRARERLQKRY